MGVVKVRKYKQLMLPNTTVIKLITVPMLSSLMKICQFPTLGPPYIRNRSKFACKRKKDGNCS